MSMPTWCAVACVIASGACVSPDERPATWNYVHAAILVPSCATATCHSSIAERGGVVLEDPDDAYQTLIDGGYVVPGDDNSTLLFLLTGEERVRMPPDGPLPEADVELIRTWIREGAEP